MHVPLNNLSYIDHSCLELLEEWGRANAAKGSKLVIEARGLKRRLGRAGADHDQDRFGAVNRLTKPDQNAGGLAPIAECQPKRIRLSHRIREQAAPTFSASTKIQAG